MGCHPPPDARACGGLLPFPLASGSRDALCTRDRAVVAVRDGKSAEVRRAGFSVFASFWGIDHSILPLASGRTLRVAGVNEQGLRHPL